MIRVLSHWIVQRLTFVNLRQTNLKQKVQMDRKTPRGIKRYVLPLHRTLAAKGIAFVPLPLSSKPERSLPATALFEISTYSYNGYKPLAVSWQWRWNRQEFTRQHRG